MNGATLFRTWRDGADMSQAKVAAKLGVTQVAVCDWENGKRTPKQATLKKIAKLSKGAVPVSSWETGRDRLAARKAARDAIEAAESESSH